MRLFSYRDRPVHLGPYPLERLSAQPAAPDLAALPPMQALHFDDTPTRQSLVHAMARYMAMFDLVRDGAVNPQPAEVPDDPVERAQHLKAAGLLLRRVHGRPPARCPPRRCWPRRIRNPQVRRWARNWSAASPPALPPAWT